MMIMILLCQHFICQHNRDSIQIHALEFCHEREMLSMQHVCTSPVDRNRYRRVDIYLLERSKDETRQILPTTAGI